MRGELVVTGLNGGCPPASANVRQQVCRSASGRQRQHAPRVVFRSRTAQGLTAWPLGPGSRVWPGTSSWWRLHAKVA